MRFWLAILVTCFCLFTSSTCEQTYDAGDLDTEQKLVINSTFSPDSIMKVFVSHSLAVTASPTEVRRPIANVEVEITDQSDNRTILQLDQEGGLGPNYYVNPNFKPVVGEMYEVNVSAPKYESAFASDMIPVANNIEEVTITNSFAEKSRQFGRTDHWFTLNFKIPNLPGENYYHLFISREEIFYNDNPNQGATIFHHTNSFVLNDLINFENPNGLVYFDNSIFIKDDNSSGSSLSFSADVGFTHQPSFELIKHLRFELRTVSEAYYKYFTTYRKQNNLQDNFGDQTILLMNVENGYGIFGGYSQTIDSLIVQ